MKSDLEDRTFNYALTVIGLYGSLSKSIPAQVIGRQVLRSGTSVGANYREARQARSRSEFSSKIGIVLQELSETDYWLRLLLHSDLGPDEVIRNLCSETAELMAIFTTSRRTSTMAKKS